LEHCPDDVQQIVGRERRERLSQLAWCGEGCFDSRRRVNSTVMPFPPDWGLAMWFILIQIAAFVLVAGYLIYSKVPLPKKEELAKTINIVGFVFTAGSLVWAAYAYFANAERQNSLLATSIYQEHMKTTMDERNKDFLGSGKFAQMDPKTVPSGDAEYERYQWYVGNSLFNFESILEAFPKDEAWNATFKGFINDHRKYIASTKFPCNRYSDNIQQLVKETVGRDCSK
jgi:hypothetical protein